MGFPQLIQYALGSVCIWGASIGMLFLIAILYLVQNFYIKQDKTSTQNLGNAIGGLGIVMCLLGVGWVLALVFVVRDSHNLWTDASSLFVSRKNLLVNWFNQVTRPAVIPPAGAGVSSPDFLISSETPKDGSVCFESWGNSSENAFDQYKALISFYDNPKNLLIQGYASPDPNGDPFYEVDSAENQRALTLAYYRFLYCHQKLMTDVLNKTVDPNTFSFLSSDTISKLNAGIGCLDTSTATKISDITYCLSPDWPSPNAICSIPNPCFAALSQSIAAQCLLVDDQVFKTQNVNTQAAGALTAFGVIGAPTGYQVGPPVKAP